MTNEATVIRHRFAVRAVLVQLGAIQAFLGVYALLWPVSFYEDFPFGRSWVEALPAYNEHLVRDVGGLFLGVGFLLLAVAVRMERRFVGISLISYMLFSVPHAAWHLFHLEPYSTGDAVANAVTLTATVLLPAWALWVTVRAGPARSASDPKGAMRIDGVPDSTRNPLARFSFFESRRRFGKVTDPLRIYAHHPVILSGYAAHELATERATRVPERLKHLAELRAAMLCGCEWCCDFGSALDKGVGEDDMKALLDHRGSDRFTEVEMLVLDYATGMSRTPVEISDDLFARLRAHLDEAQLVELTDIVALENYRARFNWAFGVGSQDFSEGAYCVRPQPAASPQPPPAA